LNKARVWRRSGLTVTKQVYDPTSEHMKISVIFGTRPEAIKLAPVILALRSDPLFQCRVCITAQHREMLDQVLDVFQIVPDTDLNLMRPNQTLSSLTASAITALDGYLAAEKPDLILVQGDTTTVFVASLAAFYHHIPVGHVEAGLRTGNMQAPWPEEANRVLTTDLATLHFVPTALSQANLLREGISSQRVYVTGNTVIDALFLAVKKIRSTAVEIPGLNPEIMNPLSRQPLVLITGHRRESFGDKLRSICRAVDDLAAVFPHVQFVYPVHLNPNVRAAVSDILIDETGATRRANIHLIEPIPYLPFVALMERATLILTDSGGIQEEAPSLAKPVLVTRDTTERPEALSAGTAKLVGADRERIVAEVSRLLTDSSYYGAMSHAHNPYGDGKATERILEAIRAFFGLAAQSSSSRLAPRVVESQRCD
jgi:UDP-N-acetylglucosamine 2-epimerase (non-hydrolysing)